MVLLRCLSVCLSRMSLRIWLKHLKIQTSIINTSFYLRVLERLCFCMHLYVTAVTVERMVGSFPYVPYWQLFLDKIACSKTCFERPLKFSTKFGRKRQMAFKKRAKINIESIDSPKILTCKVDGCPKTVTVNDRFYRYLVNKSGLNQKSRAKFFVFGRSVPKITTILLLALNPY